MTTEWLVASWVAGIIFLSVAVLWANERLRRLPRFENWIVPPVLVLGCVVSYLVGLVAIISLEGTIKEVLLYPLVVPGVLLWLCAVMVMPLWLDILAGFFCVIGEAARRVFKKS